MAYSRLWNDTEMEMVLYFYLTHDKNFKKRGDEIIDLTNRLNYYTRNRRTIDSIYMRLMNYITVDPNMDVDGLPGGEKQCQKYWDMYSEKFDDLKEKWDVFIEKTNNVSYGDYIFESDKTITSINLEDDFEKFENEVISKLVCDEKLLEKDAFIKHAIESRNPVFQQHFKNGLLKEFNCKCAICGIGIKELLVASHILPYSMCINKKDMFNSNNGLLLCSLHDALFDKKLISFDQMGRNLINNKIDFEDYNKLGISDSIFLESKFYSFDRKKFMNEHRKMFFDIDK